jgi:hypothetical protein
MVSALLIAAATHSQDAQTPFGPVPVEQRKELANRLIAYTKASRGKTFVMGDPDSYVGNYE